MELKEKFSKLRYEINRDYELIFWMKLCSIKGLGPKRILKLLGLFQNIGNVCGASKDDLLKTKIMDENMVNEWFKSKEEPSDKYQHIIEQCKKEKIYIMPLYHQNYPIELKIIASPPLNLFLQGDINLLKNRKVAIVGSRASNNEAQNWAHDISVSIAKEKIVIVSGGAYGIDISAHKGALSINAKTICVLGSGLLNAYPESHKSIFEEIKKSGLLISENEPDALVSTISLLRRNRIISAISDAMIVVTSSDKGGTMTQLDHAHDQLIPIFSPPKNIGLSPNEGLEKRREDYKIIELLDVSQIMELMHKDKPSFYSSQQKLI